jgi:Flp pilus assembly protein TadG
MKNLRRSNRIDLGKEKHALLRCHLRQDDGQAFVELALVLPIFILVLVGAVEIGYLAYASIEVSNAARAGVAYAARTHTTAKDLPNIQLAATLDAPNITTLTATPTFSCSCESSTGVMGASVDCTGPGAISTEPDSCPSPSRIVVYVKVTTSAPMNTVFHFPGIPSSITLRGSASMRVEE